MLKDKNLMYSHKNILLHLAQLPAERKKSLGVSEYSILTHGSFKHHFSVIKTGVTFNP